jgi:hypothetical protein
MQGLNIQLSMLMVLSEDGKVPLEDSTRTRRQGTSFLSPADPNKAVSVTIAIRRRTDAAQLADYNDRTTPPAKIVSRDNFAAQYGASQADLDLVTDFARSH